MGKSFRARSGRLVAAMLVLGAVGAGVVGCVPEEQRVVRVPQDAPTITEAVDRVSDGGLVLVDSGTYREEVVIDKPGVTVRGVDRNESIIDAEGIRPYGIVAVEDGVTVQNLTVTGATFYGVLFTGMFTDDGPAARGSSGYTSLDPEEFPPLQRFLIDHVTAYNNGLYGIYAFDAQKGSITNSYASGSADSGIYVGQCRECEILVRGNQAENNAVGFENANASDSVWVVENDFSGNRIGMTFLSNYQEAFAPQRKNWVAGNLIAENVSSESPTHALGGWGIGIGLSGATQNLFERNVIEGNPRAGVTIGNAEDLATAENKFSENSYANNGVDVVNISSIRALAMGNCFEEGLSTLPALLPQECSGVQSSADGWEVAQPEAPAGLSYLKVPSPDQQPSLKGGEQVPDPLPRRVTPPALDEIRVPRRL